ncbi:ATP-binding cassette domain-containing protein [Occultella kanbiaonis]|uniref:ATP-binding cassette domain-containing protein n=1 Tax=Occultella kanbiaonis TaxID=2675754 RepID=UPI0013D4AB75|nr:ABC transporter ATP-binding protein [Occultella kanbiaonis]
MQVVSLEGVEKSYHGRAILSGVDLQIDAGSAVGIQGENGSGKSVLLKIITRLVLPDAGQVTIADRYLKKGRVFPEGFGVLIDRPGYIPGQTGLQNLMSLAHILNVVTESKVRETMILVGLDPDLPQKAKHYSLGMKQRLGLAQAIMEDQAVLILDEPFNALDEESVIEMRKVFRSLVDDGRTLVMTSHQRDDLSIVCDRSYTIKHGRLEPASR